jgi:hypothetical protein
MKESLPLSRSMVERTTELGGACGSVRTRLQPMTRQYIFLHKQIQAFEESNLEGHKLKIYLNCIKKKENIRTGREERRNVEGQRSKFKSHRSKS